MENIDMAEDRTAEQSKRGSEPLLKKKTLLAKIKSQKMLTAMSIPFVLYMLLFSYVPMLGLIMAFQNFSITSADSLFDAPWADFYGFGNFKELFELNEFWLAFRNTVCMGVINLVTSTIAGIFLALVLNEVKNLTFKKITQTISYLPYFLSWIIVANLVMNVLALDGVINQILTGLHIIEDPILFLAQPNLFWTIIAVSNIWKGVGYGSIVYLAAITSIDPALYEAAEMDGAGRLRRMWNITLPCIMPTIQLLFVMNVGWVIGSGFEQQMLLRNSTTSDVATVIDLFVLKYGTNLGRFSFATAAGLFKSVANILLLLLVNLVGKRMNDTSLF